MSELSYKQQLFCVEYAVDANGKQAAIRAGYSPKTAEVQACRLLRNAKVSARVQELLAARVERTETDADWVLIQARELHERCMQEISPVTVNGKPLVDEEGRAVFRFDSAGAARSLEIIGKHVAVQAFKENMKLTGEVVTAITCTLVRPKVDNRPRK